MDTQSLCELTQAAPLQMPVEGGADFDFHRDLGHISRACRGGNAADLACSWLRTPAKDAL